LAKENIPICLLPDDTSMPTQTKLLPSFLDFKKALIRYYLIHKIGPSRATLIICISPFGGALLGVRYSCASSFHGNWP
jgi:hypothetical protein